MEKRVITAFALSALILLGWQFGMSRLYPAPPASPAPAASTEGAAPAQQSAQQSAQPAPGDPSTAAAPAAPIEPERVVSVATSRWTAKFSTRGGVPTSWVLNQGPDNKPIVAADGSALELIPQHDVDRTGSPLRLSVGGDEKRLNDVTYAANVAGARAGDAVDVADGQTIDLVFAASDPVTNTPVTKTYSFTGGQYDFGMKVDSPGLNQTASLVLGPRISDQSVKVEGNYSYTPPHAVVADVNGKSPHVVSGGDVKEGEPKPAEGSARWVGVTDNYFAMAAARSGSESAQAVSTNVKLKLDPADETLHDFVSVAIPVQSGAPIHVFVGPKDHDVLGAVNGRATAALGTPVDFEGLINYGFFAFLVRPLIPIIDLCMRSVSKLTHNYGLSIILITAIFNLLFFPLKYKSSVAMKRAAKMQPRMKELQEKMKKVKMDDPQYKTLQGEQMALMREGNPLGGCLPMLVQLPFFWAFYIYFTTSFVVRHQPFVGWVQDLSAPDHYYLLPILMCIAQIGSTMIMPMPASDDPAMKLQRQLMTWVMPIIFTYFFLSAAPSGLVLYWMTLNLVGIGIQFVINKMMPADEPAAGMQKAKAA